MMNAHSMQVTPRLWLYSIKTRIETKNIKKKRKKEMVQVYDFIPLKQGLKLIKCSSNISISGCLWLYSIKTRIETRYRYRYYKVEHVYDFIPLKQGLKHYSNLSSYCFWNVYDFIPLKQGLKLFLIIKTKEWKIMVYDFIPLKQGLKHYLSRL